MYRFSLRSLLLATLLTATTLAVVVYWRTPRLERDVKARIRQDFPAEQQNEVRSVLLSCDPSGPRIHRCILHVAEGNLDTLKQAAQVAKMDSRDIMLWAEYERTAEGFNGVRVRDFNRRFDEAAKPPIEP